MSHISQLPMAVDQTMVLLRRKSTGRKFEEFQICTMFFIADEVVTGFGEPVNGLRWSTLASRQTSDDSQGNLCCYLRRGHGFG